MERAIIYVHDPMCSWCWAFEPVRKQLFATLESTTKIQRLVGGLAPDSKLPMSQQMQVMLQNTWRKIEQAVPGTVFNYNFWTQCQPRRSTYPANRAILAAKQQGPHYDELMTLRIQQAYYSEAKNPSDNSILIALAQDIGLDKEKFKQDFYSSKLQDAFQKELMYTRELGLNSFPSLAYKINNKLYHIKLDYNNKNNMLTQIAQIDTGLNN